MNSNLVLLYLDEGINYIYTLPNNFKIIVASDENDYYIEFTHEAESFKIYIVKDSPDCPLIKAMQSVYPTIREIIEDELCDKITEEIADFIVKGYNKTAPIYLYDKLEEWYALAEKLLNYHCPGIIKE